MKENVKQLKVLLENLETSKNLLKEKQDQFNEENKTLIEFIKNESSEIVAEKEVIEKLAKEDFKKNGNKKMYGGIGIQERKNIEYDSKEALKWAKEKDMFIQLDKKAFDKAVPGLDLDFVKQTTETKVTFPKIIKIEG